MTDDDVLMFWGKTRPHGDPRHKPLLHHLLDVAAVALQWQRANPTALAREAALLAGRPEHVVKTAAFLVAMHDVGKVSRGFQAKVPDLWPQRVLGQRGQEPDRGHWRNTAILLRADGMAGDLKELFPHLEQDDLAPIIAAIAGHHGKPPDGHYEVNAGSDKAVRDPELGAACVGVARAIFGRVRELIEPDPLPSLTRHQHVTQWSWRLSGLTTLADWVGSDSEIFTFEPIEIPLPDYWQRVLERADEAIDRKGLRPHRPAARPVIYPEPPRAMQQRAAEEPLTDGPQLVIIEDATGSGKTEAAIILASRMMVAGKGEGLYFALPTMATANAMYDRLQRVYRALFESSQGGSGDPSLVLAHGRSTLWASLRAIDGRSQMANGTDDEAPASAFCADWIRDHRRKAFFADVGAGTVDQAFLAVLPKKFLTLRQHALARRILIVDEAHCFDAYMCEELDTLLELHGMNGGSAIVLSATLSLEARRRLAVAFTRGMGVRDPEGLRDDICSGAYPLITAVSRRGVEEYAPVFEPALRRTVTVERAPDRETAIKAVMAAADQGAAVLVICNAVDEAVAVHASLAAHVDVGQLHLFHARFAQCDRQTIEEEVLRRFGRDAGPADRAGRIVVATQVVEQSLDLDFDFIVSDLAPVDLLIQRAGRLWRHMDRRPRENRAIAGPRLLVVSPDPQVPSKGWLEPVLGAAAFVYDHAGVMWRSATAVFENGRIMTPESFRPLIERVYAEQDVPAALERLQDDSDGKVSGERTLGRFNVINLKDGYGALSSSLSGSEGIGTRLGEKTILLRLAREVAGRLVPWGSVDDIDESMAWSLSEIQVRAPFMANASSTGAPALRERAKAAWPDWEREEIEIAVVERNGDVRLEEESGRFRFTYCRRTGLQRSLHARG